MTNKSFWKNKKVFVTGHSGFKGAWLAFVLSSFGAEVKGYALTPDTSPNLFETIKLDKIMDSVMGDIRNFENMRREFDTFKPEIVFHLAAQPLVLEGYKNPVDTYSTNVMGTVNILECVRQSSTVKSFLNVTTDKVYHNNEWCYGYRETDILDGIDPYSNSKSCSELITACYRRSFFGNGQATVSTTNFNRNNTPPRLSSNSNEIVTAISTARAGNVIGGGDFAENRIIPDCVRAAIKHETIEVRNPNSVRPYQHVLEPLFAYMMIAEAQYKDRSFANCYNVGPNESDCVTTGELTELFCKSWGENLHWTSKSLHQPKEANLLKLDCSKLKATFNWQPAWNIKTAIEKSVEWYKLYRDGADVTLCMSNQIEEFLRGY